MPDNFEHLHDEIAQYLLGQLEGDVLLSFQQKLDKDAKLKAYVAQQQALGQGVQEHGQLLDRLENSHESVVEQPIPAIRPHMKRVVGITTSLMLVTLAAWWIFGEYTPPHIPTSSGLFATYYQPYELDKSRGDEPSLRQADSLYAAMDYPNALRLYQSLTGPNSMTQFLMAICYIETVNYPQAEQGLKLIIQGYIGYANDAAWYLALIYLRQDKLEDCQQTLQELRKHPLTTPVRRAKIKQLLEQLNKIQAN